MGDITPRSVVLQIFITFIFALVVLFVGVVSAGFLWGNVVVLVLTAVLGTRHMAVAIESGFLDDPPVGKTLRWSAAIYAALAQMLIAGVFIGALITISVSLYVLGASESPASTEFALTQQQTMQRALLISAVLVLAAVIASFILAFSLATIGPTTAGEALRRLAKRWSAVTWRQLGASLVLGLGMASALSVCTAGIVYSEIAEEMRVSSITGAWGFMAEFIAIPLLLISAAALLSVHRSVSTGIAGFLEQVRKDAATTEPAASTTSRLRHAVATVIVAALVVTGPSAWNLSRAYLDGADSGVPIIAPIFALEDELGAWIEGQSSDGVEPEVLSKRLNAAGHYETASPDKGIVVLLPDLKERMGEFDKIVCRFDIRSGPREAGEQETIDTVKRDIYEISEESDNYRTKRDWKLGYCIKAVCDGSSIPGSRPVTWLVSSHVSGNEGWAGSHTTSIIFNRIFSGGGYCTNEGDFAGRYMG